MGFVREHKGDSLIDIIDEYVVIDIETTGYMTKYDSIIEVGAIKIKNGIEMAKYQQLVKPPKPVSAFITSLTGISNDMLKNQPTIKDIGNDFLEFIGDSILLGQNVHFDIHFLYDALLDELNIPLSNNFIDLLRFSRKLLPALPNHKLSTVANSLGVPVDKTHRSISDCQIAYQCYEKFKERLLIDKLDIHEMFKKKHHSKLNSKDIVATSNEFDVDHLLYNKVCVFTGKLEHMERKSAMQLVVNLGGLCANNVTKNANYLILGNNDYCSTIVDGKSSKQKKAEKMILDGADLQILPEDVFYDLVEER